MKSKPDCEEQVRELQSDLYMARRTILELMPDKIREVLESYHECSSYEQARGWERQAVEEVLALSRPAPAGEMGEYGSLTDRAYCPLCGGSAQTAYGGDGFAFPEGLRRHLMGSYNSQRCDVFAAVRELCRDRVRSALEREM